MGHISNDKRTEISTEISTEIRTDSLVLKRWLLRI